MMNALFFVLLGIFILPFIFKEIEGNLELFLLVMGLLAVSISGGMQVDLLKRIITNYMLYYISLAVLIAGIMFKFCVADIRRGINTLAKKVPMPVIAFFIITTLGIISSIITAIIAALILVEVVNALQINREAKIKLVVITCFSIGLGAALTPIGEPLATIVISKLNVDFFYLLNLIGGYVILGIMLLGLFGAFCIGSISGNGYKYNVNCYKEETYLEVVMRAAKIFLFIVGLELLGTGFKPFVESYIVPMDNTILYWVNMVSAVLDNATLAAAEVSPVMDNQKVKIILVGLITSGGMLIPGNIPNIITACKLNIGSREWAKIGIPLGLAAMTVGFLVLFII